MGEEKTDTHVIVVVVTRGHKDGVFPFGFGRRFYGVLNVVCCSVSYYIVCTRKYM